MNLTGQPVYERKAKPKKSNAATAAQRKRWEFVRSVGCMVCFRTAEIHHCFTGKGGRKDHDKVIPLCTMHHTGQHGIHRIGRKAWQATYGTEEQHIATVAALIEALQCS